MRYNLEISLEEAFRGKTATIKIPTSVTCEICGGTQWDRIHDVPRRRSDDGRADHQRPR